MTTFYLIATFIIGFIAIALLTSYLTQSKILPILIAAVLTLSTALVVDCVMDKKIENFNGGICSECEVRYEYVKGNLYKCPDCQKEVRF